MFGTLQGCCALLVGTMLSVCSVHPPQKTIRWHVRLIVGLVGVSLVALSLVTLFS